MELEIVSGGIAPMKKWHDGEPTDDGKKQKTRNRAREQRLGLE